MPTSWSAFGCRARREFLAMELYATFPARRPPGRLGQALE
jgi:hypothetical protein